MISLILLLIIQSSTPVVYASEQQTYFARIMFEQVYLYKTPIEDNSASNVFFELPKTYFVELIDEEEDFYKVNYINTTGYVKKNSVQAIDSTPQNPYMNNVSFRVYAELSRDLRSSPSITNSSQINLIPLLTKNIQYLGKITGECLIEGRTNVWYYCKYTTDKDYYGYVYSDFCDEMSTMTDNTEVVNYIDNPTFIKESQTPNTIPENNSITSIIIGILSIPALIFVLLIVKEKRILTTKKLKNKEVIDY